MGVENVTHDPQKIADGRVVVDVEQFTAPRTGSTFVIRLPTRVALPSGSRTRMYVLHSRPSSRFRS